MKNLGAVIVVLTLILAAVILFFSSQSGFIHSGNSTTITGVNCTSFATSYTIIASESGYNDSIAHRAHGEHWPLICVHSGELVTIKIVNQDNVEPHGFAISHYLEAGVTILPGRTLTLTILASTPGDFQVYCNVICAVHVFMLNGLLVVT